MKKEFTKADLAAAFKRGMFEGAVVCMRRIQERAMEDAEQPTRKYTRRRKRRKARVVAKTGKKA